MTRAQRDAMRRLAGAAMAGRGGYHVEWYAHPRYVRRLAAVVPHDGSPARVYCLDDAGEWAVWA
jgi:hypothetical protein